MYINISCKIDTSKLNQGLAIAAQFTKRTPAEAVNTAGLEVAINAKYRTPFVKVKTIDEELGTMSIPTIGRNGRELNQKYSKNKTFYGTAMGDLQKEVPLTVLIMMARARPGSNYNILTNNRYAIPQGSFKGFSRALMLFKMQTMIDNMIKQRHQSGNFLMVGWNPAIEILKRYSVNKWRRGGPPSREGENNYRGGDLGSATAAQPGAELAICIIENNIGGEGVNAANFNRALLEYGTEPLQRALDDEGAKQMQYFLDHAGKAELEKPFNALQK